MPHIVRFGVSAFALTMLFITTTTAGACGSAIPSASGDWDAPAADIVEAFAALSAEAEDLPVYVPTELPTDATLALQWWPLAQLSSADEWQGPPEPNPRVVGPGPRPELRLMISMQHGWAEIVQGVRGDLGETESEPVGDIEGNPASLLESGGCLIIQWSDAGSWFAVVTRGLAREAAVRIALSMKHL